MKKLVLTVLLTVMSVACFAQQDWDLRKNENGITVYSRKLDKQKFKEIKVMAEINCSAAKLVKIIQDVAHHGDWSYGTKTCYLISRKGKDTITYYAEANLPWPASNRDYVVQLTFQPDADYKTVKIQAHSVNGLVPDKPGVVRVPYSNGYWIITTLPNNHVHAEYGLIVDLGGIIPAWLVNSTAATGPFNSFKKLKEIAEGNKRFD